LRARISDAAHSIAANHNGISFDLNFTGIIGNLINVSSAAIAKDVAAQVTQSIERVDGFESRRIFVCGSAKINDVY
jgi:hypothetical protein